MSSLSVPEYPTERFKNITPASISKPDIIISCGRAHPTDWPTPVIRRLFNIPDPLPTGDLQLGTVPPYSAGREDALNAPLAGDAPDSLGSLDGLAIFRRSLKAYNASGRPRSYFVPLLHAFIDWLDNLRRPFGHRMNGITFTIFGKEHDLQTKLTLAHMQMPFLTVIDEEARQAYRTVPLIGKWENVRLKEAEYGLCGHDFAALLGMAQLQRFYYDVDKETYKVHIMYTSSQGDPADTAIIVTAIVPGHFLDGLVRS